MNNDRRDRLDQALRHLREAAKIIEAVASAERRAFRNLPPGFRQDHCRHSVLELTAEWLEEAAGLINVQVQRLVHAARNV